MVFNSERSTFIIRAGKVSSTPKRKQPDAELGNGSQTGGKGIYTYFKEKRR